MISTTLSPLFEDFTEAKRAIANITTVDQGEAWSDKLSATVKDLDGAAFLFGFSEDNVEELKEILAFHLDHLVAGTEPSNRLERSWISTLEWYREHKITAAL